MAKYPIIARVPEIWRRLDTDSVSRRLFGALDSEIDNDGKLISEYLSFISVDKIQDKYLPILSDLVGHEWRDDKSFLWNRNRIRFALKRASYKGTINRLTDDMVELGCESIRVTDNASKLLVLSRQGRLSRPDSYMVTKDVWHDGAFMLQLIDNQAPRIEISEVESTLRKTAPAGTIWYLLYGRQSLSIFDVVVSRIHEQSLYSGDTMRGELGFGELLTDYQNDYNSLLSWIPNRQVQKSYFPIVWHSGGTTDGTLSKGILGEDLFLSVAPNIRPNKRYYPITHHQSGCFIGNIGELIIGELPLSWRPENCAQHSAYRQRFVFIECSFPVIVTKYSGRSQEWTCEAVITQSRSQAHLQDALPVNEMAVTSRSREYLQKIIIADCLPVIATEDTHISLSWICEATLTQVHSQSRQRSDLAGDERLGITIRFTEYREGFSVAQGYLTGETNLPGNMRTILGNQGTAALPLTSYQAALQAGTQITEPS